MSKDWKKHLDKDGDLNLSNRRLKVLPPGLPRTFEKTFYCNSNKLTSLDGCPSHIGGYFFCSHNKLTSLHRIHEQIEHIGCLFNAHDNPIKGQVLGLVLIEGLQRVYLDNFQVQGILNTHLQGDILACQDELIANELHRLAEL